MDTEKLIATDLAAQEADSIEGNIDGCEGHVKGKSFTRQLLFASSISAVISSVAYAASSTMANNGAMAAQLAGEGALATELGTSAVLVALIIWSIIDTRRRGSLSVPTLCGIAGFSIFWQEFYADWGGYLLWSNAFHMLPWGSTLWTTPLKPAYTLASYPVFMCAAFTLMLAGTRWAIRTFKNVHPLLVCMLTAGPSLVLINFGLEYAAVVNAGQWTYVEVIGPALVTAKGQQPLLYPNLPFGIFGAVTCFLILRQDADGHPLFERLTHPMAFAAGWPREGMRALAWMAVWNLSYWLLLCTPMIAIRLLWGHPNPLVP